MDGVFSHEIPKMKAMLFCLWPFEVHFLRLFSAAGLAQSAERSTAEREVAASIPGTGPILRVLKMTET